MASNPSSAASNATSEPNKLKRQSNDIGWEYAVLENANDLDKLRCKLCKKVCSGGIYRIKQHIAHIKGNVASCPKSTDEDKRKCKAAIEEGRAKKKETKNQNENVRKEVDIMDEDDDCVEVGSKNKESRKGKVGSMDKFAWRIDPDSSMATSKGTRQQNINDAIWKDKSHKVAQYCARWVYESGIPFNAIDNDSFRKFVEAVGQFGPGWQPPSQYQLREPLLKLEVENTTQSLKEHKEDWASNGCSIMTDAWTDRKRRSIMNLCVNCKKGTSFHSSKECSDESHTGPYIFYYVDKLIDEIGPNNVIQVVTDNASNNMAAAELMDIKRPNMFWTSCAAHTLNLILEGIGKQSRFKTPIDKAKNLTIFIYAHHKTLDLMRRFTRKQDIVRPGATRFATSFLTLQSLRAKKEKLRLMFTSDAWTKSKLFKSAKGKTATATVLSSIFWSGVDLCLKVFAPLVKVLRLVDGDQKPSMGFLYGELKEAKEEIKVAFNYNEVGFRPIFDIIDSKSKDRLDSPLHLTAYLLNPFYFYKDQDIQKDPLVMEGVLSCIEKFFPDDLPLQNNVINVELLKYKNKDGMFGKPTAIVGCSVNDDKYDPAGWWSNYGNATPNLQRMTSRILSLTTSSSGCERNWSTFEGIHTKKRNRLDVTRLNNLVYVQFNSKLLNKKKRRKERQVDVLLAREASMAQAWIVDGGDDEEVEALWRIVGEASGADEVLEPRRSSRNVGIRELDEEDFVSDDETEEEGDPNEDDYNFESDEERVLEGYGEEELET